MSSRLEVLGCLVVVEQEHIVYYQQRQLFAQYLSQLDNSTCSYGKTLSSSFYPQKSNATKLLHFLQQSTKDHFHFIPLPSSSYKIWCIKEQNLQIAIAVNGNCNIKELENIMDEICSQFLSNFIDAQEIPLYIMRIRCRTSIISILRRCQRKNCRKHTKDYCFRLLKIIGCISTCGLLYLCTICCNKRQSDTRYTEKEMATIRTKKHKALKDKLLITDSKENEYDTELRRERERLLTEKDEVEQLKKHWEKLIDDVMDQKADLERRESYLQMQQLQHQQPAVTQLQISQIKVQLQATQAQLHSIVPQLTSLQSQLQTSSDPQTHQHYLELNNAYEQHYRQYLLYLQKIQQLQLQASLPLLYQQFLPATPQPHLYVGQQPPLMSNQFQHQLYFQQLNQQQQQQQQQQLQPMPVATATAIHQQYQQQLQHTSPQQMYHLSSIQQQQQLAAQQRAQAAQQQAAAQNAMQMCSLPHGRSRSECGAEIPHGLHMHSVSQLSAGAGSQIPSPLPSLSFDFSPAPLLVDAPEFAPDCNDHEYYGFTDDFFYDDEDGVTDDLKQSEPDVVDIEYDMEVHKEDVTVMEVSEDSEHLVKASIHENKSAKNTVTMLCCCVCIGIYSGFKCVKDICINWRNSRKLIDNVFADLENMFYLLAKLLVKFNMKWNDNCIINILKLMVLICIMYPLIAVICLIIILPSLFLLLIVRMNKIETDTKQLNIRKEKLESESKFQRFLRLIKQCFRSSVIFSFIGVYPVIVSYVIIPKYGNNDNYVALVSVGSYLCMILLLQIFGTYRGLKSFSEKNKKLKNIHEKYKPQKFKWNLGSVIAIILLFYEVFQFTLFASHIIDTDNEVDNGNMDAEIQSKNEILSFLINITYVSFEFMNANLMQMYSFFNIICVGLLLLFVIFRFMFELKKYGTLKYIHNKANDAQQFYFHSFIGTIIYGHGTLKNLNKFSCKLVSLLSDTLFLIICEKLILVLCCTSSNVLMIDESVECWNGDHQFYATINLILIGYYIPICVMIAPMFAENDADNDKKDTFCSFSSTVSFVKPFLSAITVTKCFMMICAQFIFGGNAIATILSQMISMILLLLFTLIWSFNDLKLNGLTQNKPGFPYAVNWIRVVGFGCGLIGCSVEIMRYYTQYIDESIHIIILLSVVALISIIMLIIFKSHHSKYNKFDAYDDIKLDWIIKYISIEKKLKVVPFVIETGKQQQ